jgi:hypothetical protein
MMKMPSRLKLVVLILLNLSYILNGLVPVAPFHLARQCYTTTLGASLRQNYDNGESAQQAPLDTFGRRLLHTAAISSLFFLLPYKSQALDDTVDFKRREKDFGYSLQLPETWSQPSNKPLKTHLDEVNFKNNAGGINVGITVDPVKISSLQEFGTPPEVAARVVTAEINRDGVFQVTLVDDPVELNDGSYLLQYSSEGKRGNKRNVCKIFIANQKLYVLTAQAKEELYKDNKEIIQSIVDSFSIL